MANIKSDSFVETGVGEVNIIPMMGVESGKKLSEQDVPEVIPVLALRNAILFPSTVIPITVGREKSIKLVRDAYAGNKIIGASSQRDAEIEDPKLIDLFEIGTVAKILKLIEMPDGNITAILQGIKRYKVVEQIASEPYLVAKVEYLSEVMTKGDEIEIDALADTVKDTALHILKLSPHLPQEAAFAIKNIEGSEFLVNFIASSIEIEEPLDKMEVLKEDNIRIRAMKLLELMNRQIELLKIKNDIQKKVKTEIDQQQREYYLNNQLKTIQEELGIGDNGRDFEELEKLAANKKWPAHAAEAFKNELQRLERTNVNSPDYNVQYQYVKLLVDLPWDEKTEDNLDLKHAQEVLDQDHFGLESVKDRIIEYLAVLKLKGDMKSPIICLYGPPGVGKRRWENPLHVPWVVSTAASRWVDCTMNRRFGVTAEPTSEPCPAVSSKTSRKPAVQIR